MGEVCDKCGYDYGNCTCLKKRNWDFRYEYNADFRRWGLSAIVYFYPGIKRLEIHLGPIWFHLRLETSWRVI